eukprot:GFUD01018730.1.p1 GENE.GFUD01018730.1~~GFUD01018730.1.p1  ORF type:complete len:269 (-),score=34.87 GFUD01018730.1:169-975(-)
MDFLSGFSLCHGAKHGLYVENEEFKISFREVFCNGIKNVISHGFECCYEWQGIMDLMLLSSEDLQNIEAFEDKSEDLVHTWLGTFAGWGLLSSMLPSPLQYFFIGQLNSVKDNWDREEMFSYEAAFEEVVGRYERDNDKKLDDLIPDFGVSTDELIEENENERKKLITVHFDAKWKLEVKFTIEKKRVVKTLVDAAAEVIGKLLVNEDNVERLQIPLILRKPVAEKVRDAIWIRSHHETKKAFFNLEGEISSFREAVSYRFGDSGRGL